MQKTQLGLVALGSAVISLAVSLLYQHNFEAKGIIQKNSALTEVIAPDSAFEDLHERLSNLEQRNLKTDSTVDIVALKQTLSSIQDQLTALQEQKEPQTQNSSEDNASNYLTEQQQEELATRRKEHWDSQVYDSLQNIQYVDEINELFANHSESELVNSDCGAAACRIEMTYDHTTSEPNFSDKIHQLDWVQWGNITAKEGRVLMYVSADAELMIEPSIE